MKSELVRNWLIKANNDIRVIQNELSLPEEKTVTDGVCFHSQQAIEKFFKAYLISNEVEFPKTHNLEILRELCSTKDENFNKLELFNLSEYAVDVRYEGDFYLPSMKEAKESYKIASKVKDFVLEKLEIKEEDLKIY